MADLSDVADVTHMADMEDAEDMARSAARRVTPLASSFLVRLP